MTTHEQMSARELYNLAYQLDKAGDLVKVKETCDKLFLEFPGSNEAKWAANRFKLEEPNKQQTKPDPLPEQPTHPPATRPLAIQLTRYLNREIGINCEEPKNYRSAFLTKVTDDFFSVYVTEKKITISYPLHNVLNIVEADGGVSTGMLFKRQYVAMIEVFHLVVYKGAVGFSIPIPLSHE